jgi:hypothetical protein
MVDLDRAVTNYSAQSEATVKADGCFAAGPFTKGEEPINGGEYTISITMPVTSVQSEPVQRILGARGQNISGPLVSKFMGLGKVAEYKATVTIGVVDAAKDAEERQQAEVAAAALQEKTRTTVVLMVAKSLKANLRNPSSADWVSVLANKDGSVVCIVLRAQNGFGGMNVENYTVVDGKLKQTNAAWNKSCAGKSLFDLTQVVRWTE